MITYYCFKLLKVTVVTLCVCVCGGEMTHLLSATSVCMWYSCSITVSEDYAVLSCGSIF